MNDHSTNRIFNCKALIHFASLICLISFLSCSGYKFKTPSNPLLQYNIHVLSIPMFQNKSTLPGVSGPFTREIVRTLSQYPGLKIESGDSLNSDGVLLGIVSSDRYWRNTLRPVEEVLVDKAYGSSIGNRRDFRVPKYTDVNLFLTLILIKAPSRQDIDVLLNSNDKNFYQNPKIIFVHDIKLNKKFQRELFNGQGSDSGNVVNYTKNRGTQAKMIDDLAILAAKDFREMILYVF